MGLTQERLAERAGITPVYVSNVERGRTSPTLGVVCRIAEALETKASLLLAAVEKGRRLNPRR